MHSTRRGCMPFWRLCLHASASSSGKSTPAPSYDMSGGEDLFACFGNIGSAPLTPLWQPQGQGGARRDVSSTPDPLCDPNRNDFSPSCCVRRCRWNQWESVGFGATAAFFNGRVNSRLPPECPVRVAAKTARNPPSDTLIFSDGSPAGSAAGDLGGPGSWGRGGNVSDRLFGWPCFTLAAALDTEAISHGAGTSRMYS